MFSQTSVLVLCSLVVNLCLPQQTLFTTLRQDLSEFYFLPYPPTLESCRAMLCTMGRWEFCAAILLLRMILIFRQDPILLLSNEVQVRLEICVALRDATGFLPFGCERRPW